MKQSQIANLSNQELNDKLREYKRSYLNIKRAHAITPLENPLQIREMRRVVARIKTELTKRKLQ